MIIVADENIPGATEAFAPLGEVRLMAGRSIAREAVREAEALLVRSVTRVDRRLLAGSSVRFVGAATAGADHVDTAWLRDRGIEFSHAPGSNAESVAQYIAAVLFALRSRLGGRLRGKTIGIVGLGHCGSRVERIARALKMTVKLCDPPLERSGVERPFVPLAEIADSDVVTLHVPLASDGVDRTSGLIGRDFLATLRPGAILINAARGGIVDETVLLERLGAGRLAGAAIDTWIAEPEVSMDLLRAARIATPHVAGYSIEGKLRATQMLHEALCRFVGREPWWSARSALEPSSAEIAFDPGGGDEEDLLAGWIARSHPLERDDAAMRKIASLGAERRGAYFDSLRKDYPARREFGATRLSLAGAPPTLVRAARALGFDAREESL